MNNAVADAAHYVRAVVSLSHDKLSTLDHVIARYDEEVIARGAEEVNISHAQTRINHNFDEFLGWTPGVLPSSKSALEV